VQSEAERTVGAGDDPGDARAARRPHPVVEARPDLGLAGFTLAAVAKGPLEPDAPDGTVTAYPGGGGLMTDKPARHVREIKRIVLVTDTERTSSCGMYADEVTKERVEVFRYANDLRAKAYDRKTGKVIAEREFTAKFGKCEKRVAKSANNSTTADWELVKSWARSL
jgi:hypothetical protein